MGGKKRKILSKVTQRRKDWLYIFLDTTCCVHRAFWIIHWRQTIITLKVLLKKQFSWKWLHPHIPTVDLIIVENYFHLQQASPYSSIIIGVFFPLSFQYFRKIDSDYRDIPLCVMAVCTQGISKCQLYSVNKLPTVSSFIRLQSVLISNPPQIILLKCIALMFE